jgi:hypothetical protein
MKIILNIEQGLTIFDFRIYHIISGFHQTSQIVNQYSLFLNQEMPIRKKILPVGMFIYGHSI